MRMIFNINLLQAREKFSNPIKLMIYYLQWFHNIKFSIISFAECFLSLQLHGVSNKLTQKVYIIRHDTETLQKLGTEL